MLSRVADCLYWIGRYIERVENTARLLEVNLQLMLDFDSNDEGAETNWQAVLQTTLCVKSFYEEHQTANNQTVTDFLTFNRQNHTSIISSIHAARENARMIRDQITEEMWEAINELYHFVRESNAEAVWHDDVYTFFRRIKGYVYRMQGLTHSTYVRKEGYKFMQIGQFLERADQTTRILDLKTYLPLPETQSVGGVADGAGWVAVLKSSSALDAYLHVYPADVQGSQVAEFLILSPDFPRSLRFCLRQIDQHLRALSGTGEGFFSNPVEKAVGRLRAEVAYTTREEIDEEGLHHFVDRVQRTLNEINNEIFETYFALPAFDLEKEIARFLPETRPMQSQSQTQGTQSQKQG
ncbi:MAG: alpha-E domain-containing protein [Verrucomicrobiota bacterium JB022]|nr:alpha-E domain-containing protein [Verrucomicrobiota bacterium JB022]